jgi:hypothetical protein
MNETKHAKFHSLINDQLLNVSSLQNMPRVKITKKTSKEKPLLPIYLRALGP